MKKLLFLFFATLSIQLSFSQTYRGGFVYNFHDASMAPQYHRSYMIDIEDTVVKFIIDSYQDILFEETFSISGGQLADFKKKIKACKLKSIVGKKEPKGCTGGTSDSFFFYYDDEHKYDYYMSRCGGNEYGTAKGKIDDARALFKSMVPDFTSKMESTKK